LAHAFLWDYSYKRLKLAQLLGQLGSHLRVRVALAPERVRKVAAPDAAVRAEGCDDAAERCVHLRVRVDLGVEVKVILTPPCIFHIENH
jgi:hypothetical protein